MNKLIVMTIIALGFAQQSMADWSYQCSNSEGQTLKIHAVPLTTTASGTNTTSVTATLMTPEFSESFKGNGRQTFHHDLVDLKDSTGKPAKLEVVTKTDNYGGRCGRCSPVLEVVTYAKLNLADGTEFNFICQ